MKMYSPLETHQEERSVEAREQVLFDQPAERIDVIFEREKVQKQKWKDGDSSR
jgi:hypothetical protein